MSHFIGKGHLDRDRARMMMQRAGLDALVLIQPETIVYATGASPGNAAKTRRLGAAMLLIPADPAEPAAMIVGDYYAEAFRARSCLDDVTSIRIWVDTADIAASADSGLSLHQRLFDAAAKVHAPRPSSFDRTEALSALAALLKRRGLASARIGTEMGFLPHADASALFDAVPGVTWCDATSLITWLRAVKSPAETALLKQACLAAERGLHAVKLAFRDGVPGHVLQAVWETTTVEHAQKAVADAHVSTWASIAIGPELRGAAARVTKGDIVKLDVGCVIDGYSSDGARTFCLGRPSNEAKNIHDALRDAQLRAMETLRPGQPCSAIFAAARKSMWDAGFTTFNRGHFGHSLGASLFVEEAPFFSADEDFLIEAGMIVAVEAPWYVKGVGALMVEDPLLVTDQGIEALWHIDAPLLEL